MNKLIFNEKLYVEQVVLKHDKTILDINLFQLIQLLSVYYYQELGYTDKNELAKVVNQNIELFNFDDYFYEKYYKIIKDVIRNVIKHDIKLKDVYSVPIYHNEYDKIKSCGDKKHQKLLLTLYVMARWNNDVNGWTSNKSKTQHIKKSANLNCTNKELDLLFYDLIQGGYINSTHKAGQFCYQMTLFETDKNTPISMTFNSFNNLGNQFIASQNDIYIVCECCGKLIKRTNNRQKYCKKCADKIHKEQDKVYHEKKQKK